MGVQRRKENCHPYLLMMMKKASLRYWDVRGLQGRLCQRTNASHSRFRGRLTGKGSTCPVRFYYGMKKENKTKMQVRKAYVVSHL